MFPAFCAIWNLFAWLQEPDTGQWFWVHMSHHTCLKDSIQYYPPIHTEVIQQSKSCKLHLDYNKNTISCNFSPLLNYCNVSVTQLFVHRERSLMCVCIYNVYCLQRHLLKGPCSPNCTRWFKYDRDWFACKQAALRSSCATLREWSHNLHPPSCSG